MLSRVTSTVRLSHLEFDLLWEHLGLSERPYPIDVASFGETMAERADLRAGVRQSLRDKGLHDGDEVAPRLEELLLLLVRNSLTVDGQLSVGRHLQVLAATKSNQAVLAAQTDDEVTLTEIRGTGVVPAVVGLLPDEKPGPGGSVRLTRAAFDEAIDEFGNTGYVGLERSLQRGGVTGRDLRTVITLVESGRHGGGQLAATSVDQLGRRTRTPVLNWFDTEPGRYLVQGVVGRDGVEWLTVAPADSGRIAQRLTEMVTTVGNR